METKSDCQIKPRDKQVGGTHYKDMIVQPIEAAYKNKLDPYQFNITKYVWRHKTKNGREDLDKAIHLLEMYKEEVYPE